MWVPFPWINANVMHELLHVSPMHGKHRGGVFRFGCIGWCATVVHTSKGGVFITFSSIPTEWRNKSFKMDIRQRIQGWKLSNPYVTRWGLRHSLHPDALDWGIRLWFGEKALGREGIRFSMQCMRKKHRAPKHI